MRAKSLFLIPALALGFLTACGGAAAIEDLEKLKDKTCECGDDEACVDEAKKMVHEWVDKHKNARGGDQEKLTKIMEEMAGCNAMVALEFASAAQEASE